MKYVPNKTTVTIQKLTTRTPQGFTVGTYDLVYIKVPMGQDNAYVYTFRNVKTNQLVKCVFDNTSQADSAIDCLI